MHLPNTSSILDIPISITNEWNKRRSRGDIRNLIEFTGRSKPVINLALNHHKASAETIINICKYFSKKNHVPIEEIEKTALSILKPDNR